MSFEKIQPPTTYLIFDTLFLIANRGKLCIYLACFFIYGIYTSFTMRNLQPFAES